MRRLFVGGMLAAACVLGMASSSYAQILVGAKGGVNFANLNQDPEDSDCCDMATRFAIGGFVEKAVKPSLGIEVDALYNQGGAKGKADFDGSINVDEFQIPVLIKGNFATMSKARPYVVTGPGLGFITSAKVVDNDGNVFDDLKENDEVETFNFSWVFGVGVHVGKAGSVEFRYDLGLTDLSKDDDETVKSRVMSILFGWGFGAK